MEEINFYDLLRFYTQKWLTILTIIIIGGIAGVTYTYYIQQPQYTSTATLLLVGSNRSAGQESFVLNNYVELFKSRSVLESVVSEQRYKYDYDTLAANTTVENVKNTDIINISMTTPEASTSKKLLETSIQEFRDESNKLYGDSSVKINVVDEADVPSKPSNIKPIQQIGFALSAAFIIAILAVFFAYDYKATQQTAKRKKAAIKKQPAKTKAAPSKKS